MVRKSFHQADYDRGDRRMTSLGKWAKMIWVSPANFESLRMFAGHERMKLL